ncbi:hypothetical protein A8709_05485 [Paenibacillus pectinilyticus]|uniref:Sec-independent protein translocase protein TatA n=1 Tax=Paenibacillus pectinilyticus TaxID=512399 RepID=A0A1C0ZST5_9BACL|nr:twin-arginine translocase TatA/TatE family subunit [Paenibacillus pectinilyticus]OCT11140.1 hypothetical protein A8709_05485 [Paenibacillus pectinilyticus]
MFQNIGFSELLLIAVVALVLFGPQKLPEIGRMLGKTLRDFKQAANELMKDEPKPPQVSQATSAPLVPDPVSPVVVAGNPAQDEVVADESIAPLTSNPVQVTERDASDRAEDALRMSTEKPAVAFVTNKSSKAILVTGSPVTAESIPSAADVLASAPAQASAPTPAQAQQPGSTSNVRRLPD